MIHNPECIDCSLHEEALHVCQYGMGAANPKIMIISEPVKDKEDKIGKPFAGKSYHALDLILQEVGIKSTDLYTTNVVKCKVDGKAKVSEINACKKYWQDEIRVIQPKMIILMGATALKSVLGFSGIDKSRRQEFEYEGIPTFATYHPDICFYKGSAFANEIADDIKFALGDLKETEIDYTIISKPDWSKFFTPMMCLDIETNDSLDPWDSDGLITDVAICNERNEVVHRSGESNCIKIISKFVKRANRRNTIVVGHNNKFDFKYARNRGLDQLSFIGIKLFDTLVASSFIDENYPNKSLGHLCQVWLNIKAWKHMTKGSVASMSRKDRRHYNSLDVVNNLALAKIFQEEMISNDTIDLFWQDMETAKALTEIELNGFYVNKKRLIKLDRLYTKAVKESAAKIPVDNPNSPQQIARLLYIKKAIPYPPTAELDNKTKKLKKTIRSARKENKEWRQLLGTSEDILVSLIDGYAKKRPKTRQLLIDILRYRTLETMRNKFTDGWLTRLKSDGCLHGTYKLAKSPYDDAGAEGGTITGRLGMSDPNMMQVPRKRMTPEEEMKDKGYIREALPTSWNIKNVIESRFKGGMIFQGDADQAEMRGAANFSNDPIMCKAYINGEDLHIRTAAEIAKKTMDEVTSFMRKAAKTCNFGVIYGSSAWTMAEKMSIPVEEAQGFINGHKKTFPTLWKWKSEQEEYIINNGEIQNIFGRIRHLPGATTKTPLGRAKIREGINFLVQGPVSELTKYVMTKFTFTLIVEGFKSLCIGNVHDAILADIHPDERQEVIDLFNHIAREGHEIVNHYPVKFIFTNEIGKNWANTVELELEH